MIFPPVLETELYHEASPRQEGSAAHAVTAEGAFAGGKVAICVGHHYPGPMGRVMRVGLGVMLAGIATLPRGASAQTEEHAPLELESTHVAPTTPTTSNGYDLEQMDVRVRRARIGLISTAAATVVGLPLLLAGLYHENCFFDDLFSPAGQPRWCSPARFTGAVLLAGGSAGVIATGILLGVRKRKRRVLQNAHYRRPRKVQWDLASSRVVF